MQRTDRDTQIPSTQPESNAAGITRRRSVPAAGSALAAITIGPRHVLGGVGYRAPSDKLNIAAVGVGSMGANYVKGCESENIVAFADVDDTVAAPTFALHCRGWSL